MKQCPPALHRAAVNLYRYLSTPRSLTCYILATNGEWDQLVQLKTDPLNYLDTLSGSVKFRRDTLATDFLRKNESLPTSFDREAAALETFDSCEKVCLAANEFLDSLQKPTVENFRPFEARLISILNKARKICGRILGPLPDSLQCGFGPGTAFEMKGRAFSTLIDKMYITPHVTQSCAQIFEHFYAPTLWARERLSSDLPFLALCKGNRFTTVKKTAQTRRGICIEPLGNLFVQLGIGRYLKGRLKQVGLHVDRSPSHWMDSFIRERGDVDLRSEILQWRSRPNGQFIHRRLAVKASMDDGLATIDLSNASDTVCRSLVRWLIPEPWHTLLDSCRSTMTQLNGKWHHLEKFSSMGNGFTFELETLIFASLSAAVSGKRLGNEIFVYGDDILVPSIDASDVLALLRSVGFTPNERKSFTSGPFRESCGGDYFDGWPVRAVFTDEEPDGPIEWMSLHNALLRWLPNGAPRARTLLSHLREQVPRKYRLSGPPGLGDGVFHTTRVPSYSRCRNGITWFRTVSERPFKLGHERWSDHCKLSAVFLGCFRTEGKGFNRKTWVMPRRPQWAPREFRFTRQAYS